MIDFAKGGNVQFALRRLMAQLEESPGLVDRETHSALQDQAAQALPNPATATAAPSMTRRLSDQAVANSAPTVRQPATAQQLVQRLRGNDLVEPQELNHLLYSSPEAHAAINAYQGGMDSAAVQGQSVDPAVRERLAQVLEAQSGQPSTLLNQTGMAEGGSFDPIASARDRVRGSSSPGTPGVSGAIGDAVAALQNWMHNARGVATGQRDDVNMSGAQNHADGGTTGPSTEHESSGLLHRFGARVAEQAYGLDAQGNPALGGRAWTSGQGGTPMGLIDEIAAVPHNLLSLAHTTRSLADRGIAKHMPGYSDSSDNLFDSVDPQWSKDASGRLDQLRQAMNKQHNLTDASTFPEHLVDSAASLVSPVPMAAEGKEANLANRLAEMTIPVRPRTMKNYATDSTVMGGIGSGVDALTQKLSQLRAQNSAGPGGGTPVDPSRFSQDMGAQPEDDGRDINNNHRMVPIVKPDGSVIYGVDPSTF